MTRAPKLLLPRGWRLENVGARMRKGCKSCGVAPEGVRFRLQVDSYPYPTVEIYCASCALDAMRRALEAEQVIVENLKAHLQSTPNK